MINYKICKLILEIYKVLESIQIKFKKIKIFLKKSFSNESDLLGTLERFPSF